MVIIVNAWPVLRVVSVQRTSMNVNRHRAKMEHHVSIMSMVLNVFVVEASVVPSATQTTMTANRGTLNYVVNLGKIEKGLRIQIFLRKIKVLMRPVCLVGKYSGQRN